MIALWLPVSVTVDELFAPAVISSPVGRLIFAPALAVSFDARWKLVADDHSARYGGGLEYFLSTNNGQSGFPIRAGVLHDNGLDETYLSEEALTTGLMGLIAEESLIGQRLGQLGPKRQQQTA